ncbi:hypothetical protein [Ruegeria sp. HKCCD8929]|uniref:hypothetical protein n=1 Tax=Ruegeria sp. HKCCD8929 TaxID=2683006 RepID=UPI001488639C|nr:hypothetical protein [Ruegeria sp. HKCCD8929]
MEDNAAAFAAGMTMATQMEIEQFEIRLSSYEEATVVALLENQERLDAVNVRLLAMLDQAYVMDDGRRVFRTMDGLQVFDEFGQEVSHDEIDPAMISDEHPFWEDYQPAFAEQQALMNERDELLAFQERLDEAREEIADGEISKAELEDLDAELADMMPPSVRPHVPGMEMPEAAPELAASFSRSAAIPQVPSIGAATPALSPIQ